VEQLEAVSRDGTRIPYFIVRPREARLDGTTPTLLTAFRATPLAIVVPETPDEVIAKPVVYGFAGFPLMPYSGPMFGPGFSFGGEDHVLARNVRDFDKDTIVRVRSFYGALRVREFRNWLKEPYRTLYNGKIEHGAQYVNPPSSLLPTTYYGPDSGVGLALAHCCPNAKRVGAIGLGAGTLAAYGKTSDYFRFYEINPQVIAIAKTSFSYLRDSPARIDIVLGDARLSLQNEAPQQFDVLAVDAFSGDAIPVHLLTREAFALYLHHLKPDGVLAVHTSNSYLNLPPVVQLLASEAGCDAQMVTNDDNHRKLIDSSDWVLITRNKRFLDSIDSTVIIEPIAVPPGLRMWTDDFNNLFQILRPVKFKQRSPR